METGVNNVVYIIAGWSVVLITVAAYATVTILRGRALSRLVPVERRRWSTDENAPTTVSEGRRAR